MADTLPTPASFFRACRLCALLLVAPKRFIEIEKQDNIARKGFTKAEGNPANSRLVRAAFLKSLALVLASSSAGFALGKVMHTFDRCATPDTVTCTQIAGAALLLWGTLFVRGWEIQTYGGVSLTERVNQWLFRSLYCAGTVLVVYSLAVKFQ